MVERQAMGRGLRLAAVITPMVAVATIAVGLHVGGRWTIHAATLRTAPHARGSSAYVFQLTTLVEDQGVRETEVRTGVAVRARAKGLEVWWTGDTNEDGVAEVRIDLPSVERGDPLDVTVTANAGTEVLASGRVILDETAWLNAAPGPFVRAGRREGVLAIDAAILGERLVARVPVPLYVRVTSRDDGHPVKGVTLTADPEPGLDVSPAQTTTCANGWARFSASPILFAAATTLHARTGDGRSGDLFAELPVAPGAMDVRWTEAQAGLPIRIDVRAPSPRAAYIEIDDDTGRAFADAALLVAGPDGATASFESPPLAAGLWWLVTSSEPRGAEALGGASLARPFLVAGKPMPSGEPNPDDPCAASAYLATHPAGGFRRQDGLDGFPEREAVNTSRRKRGLGIALSSLAIGGALEVLILVEASRRGRSGVARARDLVNVVIVVLLGALGFGLLAALLLSRA